jgi:hypothetical protein
MLAIIPLLDAPSIMRLAFTCTEIRKEVLRDYGDEYSTACANERARVVAKIVKGMEAIWPGCTPSADTQLAFQYNTLPWSETRLTVYMRHRVWCLSNKRLSKKLLLGRGMWGRFRSSDALLEFMSIFGSINGQLQSAMGELLARLEINPTHICDIERITREVGENGVEYRGRVYRMDDGTWFQREMR